MLTFAHLPNSKGVQTDRYLIFTLGMGGMVISPNFLYAIPIYVVLFLIHTVYQVNTVYEGVNGVDDCTSLL